MVKLADINEFLAIKETAFMGVSRNSKKFANHVFRLLKEREYKIYPVNPNTDFVEGSKCYYSIKALPMQVHSAIIMLPPEKAIGALKDIAEVGIKYVWLQQYSDSQQAIQFCKDNNIKLIHGECIVMFLEPLGLPHRIHKWIKKISGCLPKES